MSSETRFLALVTALLMLWVVSSAIRESTVTPVSEAEMVIDGPAQPSDERLKENVHDLPYGLPALMGLRPVSYRYKDFPSRERIGFIAQEINSVVPEVVHLLPENPESRTPRYYSVNYAELVPLLVRSIQQQQKTIESLQTRVESLEAPKTQ